MTTSRDSSAPRDINGYDPFRQSAGFRFDEALADRAVDFFTSCLTFTGAEWRGKPFKPAAWQRDVIRTIFGWVDERGLRRYREVLIFIPRKNGKTELAAGLGNYLLFADGEPGAQIYCAAADRNQARYVHDAAKSMVEHDNDLTVRSIVYLNSIAVPSTGSTLKVISAEAYSKHGGNAHGIIIDELHAQPNRELVDVLNTSTGARRQPLTIYITTADYDRPSVCNEKYRYAKGVAAGTINDPSFLPVVYEIGEDDDWKSESSWRKANPNYGVTISEEYLRRECRRAENEPSYELTFRRLHLNQRTQAVATWISLDAWDRCAAGAELPVDGRVVVGLDLSATTDLTALVMAWRSGAYVCIRPYFWMPEETAIARERQDRAFYLTWAAAGWLTLTPGKVVNYDYVKRQLTEISSAYGVDNVIIDPHNARQLANELERDNFTVTLKDQTYAAMNGPTKELERMIVGGVIRHDGNPLMRWMLGNVAIDINSTGDVKPTKRRSTGRIDGVVAAIMAIEPLVIREETAYEFRGFVRV